VLVGVVGVVGWLVLVGVVVSCVIMVRSSLRVAPVPGISKGGVVGMDGRVGVLLDIGVVGIVPAWALPALMVGSF
jgi:hypothetical protein